MSNGGSDWIVFAIVFLVGVGVGYGAWHTDSAKLDSIINTLDAMSNVEMSDTQGNLQIKYPLLIHSEKGTETTIEVTVLNQVDTEQNFLVEFRNGIIGDIPEVDIPPWSATLSRSGTASVPAKFTSYSSGYNFIELYLNDKRVGEIIFISE